MLTIFPARTRSPNFWRSTRTGQCRRSWTEIWHFRSPTRSCSTPQILSGSEKHYPRDLKKRADINRWLLWEASTWFPSCYTYLVEYVVKPLLKTEPDETIIEKEAPNWHRLAGILDARLAKSKWLAGDTLTIADIAVAAPMHLHKWQRLPLDEHANLKRWMADVEQLPCWQKTQGAVEQALQLR